MRLVDAIVARGKAQFSPSNSWYVWRTINQTLLPPGVGRLNGSEYEQNVELKYRLHRQWVAGDETTRAALGRYYVATWGGVRRNNPGTLTEYTQESIEATIRRGKKGIPSWSKVLCIRNPDTYAIYDARVAISLNLLQHLHGCDEKELFPLLTGQNRNINAAVKRFARIAQDRDWRPLADDMFYERYLSHARMAASMLGVALCTVEMFLFASAPLLVDEAHRFGRL